MYKTAGSLLEQAGLMSLPQCLAVLPSQGPKSLALVDCCQCNWVREVLTDKHIRNYPILLGLAFELFLIHSDRPSMPCVTESYSQPLESAIQRGLGPECASMMQAHSLPS